MSELSTTLRRSLLQLVLGVLLLHGLFIAIFLLTPVRFTTGTPRLAFLLVWTTATLVVVLSGLHRIRSARAAARRAVSARR